jgi:sugar phosphate isomerase/epimerase
MFKIALQLYSLREQMSLGLPALAEKIAAAGYDGVELYTPPGLSVGEAKRALGEAGLACPSAHISFERWKSDLPGVIRDMCALGVRFAVIPIARPQTEDDVAEMAAFIAKAGAAARGAGLRLLYHNHSHEFSPLDSGREYMEALLSAVPPRDMALQFDTYWAEKAGVSCASFIERAGERIACFHLKDERAIGTGSIDFELVLRAAKELGHEWLIVEQEEFDGCPFEDVKASLDYLRALEGRLGL